ncbi:YncE family protein [Engelhardtia mirabilis]|uniref:Lactonase, 7-bladed beta-propeller n=1 Tax=Engelhardtia mirabilis TaxID=2528011 RepID=A0A518BMB0_9BACT|nr:Lactonase, 7-bladed beta-propeller [Planctomycetes bacterium Pla133]QDV02440.1 Lactonase, 7-bladed beta-propeller [Planctomycetes bacterium Pla86]
MPTPSLILLLATLPQITTPLASSAGDDPDGDPILLSLELAQVDLANLGHAGAQPTSALGGLCSGIAQQLVQNADQVEGDAPSAIAFTPDGSRYLIAHRDSANLTEFDAVSGAFLRELPISGSPQDVAVAADGTRAVVANVFEGTVSFVDLASGAEYAVTGGVDLPAVVRITHDSALAVVGAMGTQELVVFDMTTGLELRRIGGMGFASTLSFAPEPGAISLGLDQLRLAGNTAIHPDYYADEIEVVDVTTGAVTTLAASDGPRGIAVTPDGALAVITNTGTSQSITLLDVASATIVKDIAIGQSVREPVAVEPTGAKAAVAVQNAVVMVDLATNAVGANLNTASVNQLLTTADGQYVLGVGFFGSLLEYATSSKIKDLNNQVSAAFGAVSPTSSTAVMVATTFGEDRLVVDTAGAAGSLLLAGNTGQGLEADSTRRVAVSLDGQRAVTTNILMDTASVWDVPTGTLLGVVQVGNRPSGVAVTPDGSKAVVANLDSTFASVIDLATLAVTNVAISTRGSEVEISPDGQYAYVAVVSGGDGVWRIDLNTLTTAGAKLATGDMGSISFPYTQSSGISLSPNGATLAVCGSFSDSVTLIDTATWTVLGDEPTGSFPVRAAWAANSGFVFVACRDSDELTRVRVVGGTTTVVATIAVGQWPYEMEVSADGKTVWVLEYLDDSIGVVDVPSGLKTGEVALPDNPVGLVLDPSEANLYVVTGGWSATIGGSVFSIDETGELHVVDTASLSIVHSLDNGWAPAGLAATPSADVLLVPAPRGDGLGFARTGQALTVDVDSISVSAGGVQSLCLDAGAGAAGQLYLVLGSASGSSPGLVLDGVTIPLNLDAYLLFTLDLAGSAPFVGTFGLLDGLGEGSASIALPPGTDPALAGVSVIHAFVAADAFFGTVTFASNAVGLTLVP